MGLPNWEPHRVAVAPVRQEGMTVDCWRFCVVPFARTTPSARHSWGTMIQAEARASSRWRQAQAAVFKLYDRDGSGRLGAFELRQALNSAGYHLNNRVLNALAHRYGSRDGKIAFDDFIMCAVKIKTMIDIFRERDVDGTNMATFSMEEWVEKTVYS
uniref:EF-hand domain-containing protein n=1 Tax=Lutzomyia longipalpis TaxID=7200 RepID=A0A1B0GLJ5_LUTLO